MTERTNEQMMDGYNTIPKTSHDLFSLPQQPNNFPQKEKKEIKD